MKKRFIKNLQRIVNDISVHQTLQTSSNEVTEIQNDANRKYKYAILAFVAAAVLSVVEWLLL
jgi:predicted nucleic acid-binding Zn ribbon protein